MELPEDLLLPRPNLDIDTTIRAIRKDVRFLAKEKDPAARRGCALVLIAQLNHLVESPALLKPLLSEGLADEADDWLCDEVLAGRGLHLLPERPFENPGAAPDRFFIEFNGRLSPLFTNLPEGEAPFMGFPGHFVYVYRLDDTTSTLTSRHFTESEGLVRVAQLVLGRREGHHPGGPHLLVDPRGYARRRGAVPDSLVLCAAPELNTALRTADDLAEALHIRLLVATRVRFIDNH